MVSPNPETNGKRLLIAADELADLLQISERTLWRLLASGRLVEPVRFGGNTRWRYRDVEAWLEAGCPPCDGCNN